MSNLSERIIVDHLEGFRKRTGILCSTLFNDDGLVIAIEQEKNEDPGYYESIGALSAGIVSLAENGIKSIYEDKMIKQISVRAGNHKENDGFTILLESVMEDVILSVIFPLSLNLGVVLFELKKVVGALHNYFETTLD